MRKALAALLLASVAALPAAAQLAPERAVVPRERPADAAAPAPGDGADAPAGAPADSPEPESAPESAPDVAPEASPAPEAAPAEAAPEQAETVPQPTAAPDAAPDTVPAPPEEKPSEPPPADGASAAAPADGATPPAAAGDAPEDGATEDGAAADGAVADGAVAEPPEPPMPERLAETDLDLGMCLGRLAALGAGFERGRAIVEQGGACGIVNPLRVTEIVPGVALSPPGIMRCETALALAEWVARFALPASLMLPDRGRLTEVTNGSAYVCRAIGNGAEGDLSEHAFGNAVDIMGFRFASGPAIAVEPREREGTPAESFQRAVRATACLGFPTVLGPGVEAHEDHLHLDTKARNGGFRLCQ